MRNKGKLAQEKSMLSGIKFHREGWNYKGKFNG